MPMFDFLRHTLLPISILWDGFFTEKTSVWFITGNYSKDPDLSEEQLRREMSAVGTKRTFSYVSPAES